MQKNSGDLALQCDLLALNARLEAARSGTSDADLTLQAASLRSLAAELREPEKLTAPELAGDEPLHVLQRRLARFLAGQRDIAALAGAIETNARRATGALQFEDVESQVVVYSKHRARELRAQLDRIERLQQGLEQALAHDRGELEAKAAALQARPGKSRGPA